MIRVGASSASLVAAVVAFLANMAFVAFLLGLVVHLLERQKRRGIAQA
jgi:hypothetical protein